jgi:hypothetical protein
MPPVWTDLATAAGLVRDGDPVALGGHTPAAPTGYPGHYPQGEAHLAVTLESARTAASFTRYLPSHVRENAW